MRLARPHPNPLPRGEGNARQHQTTPSLSLTRTAVGGAKPKRRTGGGVGRRDLLPLLGGEGRGEGGRFEPRVPPQAAAPLRCAAALQDAGAHSQGHDPRVITASSLRSETRAPRRIPPESGTHFGNSADQSAANRRPAPLGRTQEVTPRRSAQLSECASVAYYRRRRPPPIEYPPPDSFTPRTRRSESGPKRASSKMAVYW